VADDGRIVVGVDGSAGSDMAVEWAAREALLRRLPVRVVHATLPGHLPALRSTAAATTAEWMDRGREIAGRGVRLAQAKRVPRVERRVHFNTPPAQALADEAESATLLVLGAHGRGGLKDLLLGSTAARVLEQASVPVVVVRETAATGEPGPAPDVVVGLDGSPPSLRALRHGWEEAALRGTGVTAVHARATPEHPPLPASETHDLTNWSFLGSSALAAMVEWTATASQRFPDVQLTRRMVDGPPDEVLVDMSQQAELLVLGSRGRGGLAGRMLGSVSQRVVHRARCPVAVLR